MGQQKDGDKRRGDADGAGYQPRPAIGHLEGSSHDDLDDAGGEK